MKINHIGYLVENIKKSSESFMVLGYEGGQIFDDDIQKCHICFMKQSGSMDIELVQPYECNKSMTKMLAKRGSGVYHLCYEVGDVKQLYDSLINQAGWMPLFEPVSAIAFNNKLITYFHNDEIGLMEFLNTK